MNTIPNIITNKDLVCLKDLFYKNYYLYKELEELTVNIKDKEISNIVSRVKNMHEDHMYFIISSLKKENNFIGDEDE